MNKPIFEENTGLIWHVINKNFGGQSFKNPSGITAEDLYQIGAIALFKAIETYNPNTGYKFATYAVPKIWGSILKELRDIGHQIKVPRQSRQIHAKIKKREVVPTVEEIMKEFNASETWAIIALELLEMTFTSMDKPMLYDGKPTFLHDLLEDENYNTEKEIMFKMELEDRLSVLDERERKIIELSMKELPQREIAEIFGISQVQVSRILKKALDKAKNRYEVVAV